MEPILSVNKLKKYFEIKPETLRGKKAYLKAVDDVSFQVYPSETLGIVGESGCGKSTLGKTMIRLLEKDEGQVVYKGQDIFALDANELKAMRKSIQMVFQDPFSSLNPRKRVEQIVGQPLRVHRVGAKADIRARVEELLSEVGLDARYKRRYPHQFSGGQRQRIGIARALALNPDVMICDEAVSALDVSVQAQILNLLRKLQEKYRLTYIFIAHDLSVVEFISDRILVMYLGKVVELASKHDLVQRPLHPYTQSLFAASPGIDPRKRREDEVIMGDVPSPINPPQGCYFHPRCPHCMEVCRSDYPPYRDVEPGHAVACHLSSSYYTAPSLPTPPPKQGC